MSTELYDLTVPVFIRTLGILSKFLEKGRAHAIEKGIDESDFLTARLYEDMAPLTAQIQRVSDTSKGFAVRVGGVDNVAMEDNETSFDELQARNREITEALERQTATGAILRVIAQSPTVIQPVLEAVAEIRPPLISARI